MAQSRRGSNPSSPRLPALPRSILPRVGGQPSPPQPSQRRSRVGRACSACRQRRIRCSGDKPCSNCVAQGIECRSWETKRAKEERILLSLQYQNNAYEQLLQDISGRVGPQDAQRIQSLLSKNSVNGASLAADLDVDVPQEPLEGDAIPTAPDVPGADGGDSDCNGSDSSSVGSLDGADRVGEDVDRNEKARATGFIGKASEITWLRRMGENAPEGTYLAGRGFYLPLSSVDYHQDDLELSITEGVDPYQLPPKPLAGLLLDTYFASVHPSFPIVDQASILSGVEALYDTVAPQPEDGWLAALQLVFAIAAERWFATLQTHPIGKRDHIDFFSRATNLFVEGDVLLGHPDLQEIQFLALLAFYLLSVGHVNRSWKVSGLAMRSAFALGLNMKDTTPQTESNNKEERYRVWWSLLVLEHFLVGMTGRLPYVSDTSHSTPLPLPFEDDALPANSVTQILNDLSVRKSYLETPRRGATSNSSKASSDNSQAVRNSSSGQPQGLANTWLQTVEPSSSLYFLYLVNLSLIAHKAQNTLYAPTVTERSWGSIESDINLLQLKTESWLSTLPDSYDFYSSQSMSVYRREKLSLAFLFYSTEIMLARPCLCRHEGQQSRGLRKGNLAPKNATQCVKSACALLELIPDHVDAMAGFLEFAPWWCLSHYVMQAAVVLLLELSMRSKHLPEEAPQVTELMKRALRFFQQMSSVSLSADRCWRICDSFVRRLAPWISLDVSGLPFQQHYTQDKNPDSWRPESRMTPSAVTNEFDQFLPFDPETGEITGSFFPSSTFEGNPANWAM